MKENKVTLILSMLLFAVSAITIWSLVRGKRNIFQTNNVFTIFNDNAGENSETYLAKNLIKSTPNMEKQNKTIDDNNTLFVHANDALFKNNQHLFSHYYEVPTLSTDDTKKNKSKILNILSSPDNILNEFTCELKSCSSANKLFKDMANVISGILKLPTVTQLKCKMGKLAAAEENSKPLPDNCLYATSESFLSLPNWNNIEKLEIRVALKIYLSILNEIQSSLLPMSTNESLIKTRINYFEEILSVKNNLNNFIKKMLYVSTELSSCACSSLDDLKESSKVYTQSYQQLISKFSHSKSAFVTLKQLETTFRKIEYEFWKRQQDFIMAC
ncbi:uncharacterized protein LOC105845520 [Hydra vulgaris]|uniref:Uncharacterized protein LOC105845520 n=1 Tax=Hydra vulgaris TaxID=6087 RepID=A0ABM4D2V9_HYDVU